MDAHIQRAICALDKKTLGDGVDGKGQWLSVISYRLPLIKDSLLVGKALPLII